MAFQKTPASLKLVIELRKKSKDPRIFKNICDFTSSRKKTMKILF